jgi:hypothetical protein
VPPSDRVKIIHQVFGGGKGGGGGNGPSNMEHTFLQLLSWLISGASF